MANPLKLPHVKVHGDISAFLSEDEVWLTLNKNVKTKLPWTGEGGSLSQAVGCFCQHLVGKKDGILFVPGRLAEDERGSKAVVFNDFMVLDVDNGTPIDAFRKKVQNRGVACIIYTSHSHGKTRTVVSEDAIIRKFGSDYSDEDVVNHLRDDKGYHSSVLENATVSETKHQNQGIVIIVTHNPMAKFRAVFPLAVSYIVREEGSTQQEAINRWKLLVQGLADELGVQVDKACKDIGHAFYFGRHNKGAEYEVHVVGGKLLDFADIKIPASTSDASRRTKQKPTNFRTKWLKKFLALHDKQFDAEGFCAEYGEILHDRASGSGYEILCPFDHEHTNPGETGCFVTNNEDDGGPWRIKCMHNACVNRHQDRADYLDELIVANDLAFEDMQAFCPENETFGSLEELRKHLQDEDELQDEQPLLPDAYVARGQSIWIKKSGDNEDEELCDLLIPLGKAQSLEGQSYSLVIKIRAKSGWRQLIIPVAELHKDEKKIRAKFAETGFFIDPNAGRKFASFLARISRMDELEEKVLLTNPGIFDEHIALPSGNVLGPNAGRFIAGYELQPDRWTRGTPAGSLEAYELVWTEGTNAMRFALIMAAAAMVIAFLAEESFAVAITGESSKGKTSALKVGASFNGNPVGTDGSTYFNMRNTDNAFEAVFARSSGALSCLDETKQFEGKIQKLIFMITGSTGKGRLTSDSEEKALRRFVVACLISSEVSIERIARKANDDPAAGMFARCFDLDVSNEETVPTKKYRQIMDGIQKHYGFGSIEFAKCLLRNDPEELREDVSAIAADFLRDHVGETPTSYEERAARKFAIIELAGVLLQEAGILPEVGPKVGAIVDWAWQNSAGRPGLQYGDPVANAVDKLRTTIAGKMGREILLIKDKDLTRHHEVKAWADDEILYLPIELVDVWAGDKSKCTAIQKRLSKMGVIIRASKSNVAWEMIPGVVKQRHYRIKLSKFLGTDREDE